MYAAHPRLGLGSLGLDHDDRMARADGRLGRPAEGVAQLSAERLPVLQRVRGEERQLAGAVERRIAIDGHAGAVGSTIGHLRQHRGEVLAQMLFDVSGLGEEADDPAHMSQIYSANGVDSRSELRSLGQCYVWFLHFS